MGLKENNPMPKPKAKHAGGRPSKYAPRFCEEVIAYLAQGHSVTAFAGNIGVARSSVFKWADDHPEFSDALKVGQARATEFWEKVLIGIARDGGGNATAAIFGLKNRASEDWSDKVVNEHSGPNGGAIPIGPTAAELSEAIASKLAGIAATKRTG